MALGDSRKMAGGDAGLETPLTSYCGTSSFTSSLTTCNVLARGQHERKFTTGELKGIKEQQRRKNHILSRFKDRIT